MNNQSISQQPTALYDIYDPIQINDPSHSLLLISGITAVCLAILILFFFLIRKRKKAALPYWENTLKQIEELQPLQEKDPALYIEKTHSLLRSYIEIRFTLQPTRQTTSEFFQSKELLKNKTLKNFHNELHDLFDQVDMMKFAHMPPAQNQLMQMKKTICSFIQQTIPDLKKGEKP